MRAYVLMDNIRPLDGIRVLDLSRDLAGPFCTMILGDLGADVIKVEDPNGGDETRIWGPPFVKGESGYFLSTNRNKRSVTINLKEPRGRKLVRELIGKSDVVVQNFRPIVAERLLLDYANVKRFNPGVVYCSVTGFGQSGPYRDRVAYDIMMQAMGGLMSVTGEPRRPPVRIGVAVSDLATGLYAAVGIEAALFRRSRTGKGECLDVSLFDSTISLMTYMAAYYFLTGRQPEKMGSAHPSLVPYQAFRARDGKYFIVAVTNNGFFTKLCKATGLEQLSTDWRFADNADRVLHRESLIRILNHTFLGNDRDSWLARLNNAGVPCGPVYAFQELFNDPQVLARGTLLSVKHHKLGPIKQIAPPIRFKNNRNNLHLPPPTLGEHTSEVLRFLGHSSKEIAMLKSEGII